VRLIHASQFIRGLFAPLPASPHVQQHYGCAAAPSIAAVRRVASPPRPVAQPDDPDRTWIIDDWRRRQPDLPARAEVIRRLIQLGLTANATQKDGVPPGTRQRRAAAGRSPWRDPAVPRAAVPCARPPWRVRAKDWRGKTSGAAVFSRRKGTPDEAEDSNMLTWTRRQSDHRSRL
jgi:hypothetical protein